jgi:prevent-host-death family protein
MTHMTRTIGVRELRQNLSRYLRRVKQGEPLTVTERGRVVARLVPAGSGLERYTELSATFGATVPRERIGVIAARIVVPGAPAGTTDAILAEGRGERS